MCVRPQRPSADCGGPLRWCGVDERASASSCRCAHLPGRLQEGEPAGGRGAARRRHCRRTRADGRMGRLVQLGQSGRAGALMRFAPEYVRTSSTRTSRRQGAVPRAADGDSLRAPGDARRAGHRHAATTRTRSATRSTRSREHDVRRDAYDGTLRGSVLLRRAVDRRRVRRGRRPAACTPPAAATTST